jgi:hypothetical protein
MDGGYADGIGTSALFQSPTSITYSDGNLFVTDNMKVIRAISLATQNVTTFAGNVNFNFYCSERISDGVGTNACFSFGLPDYFGFSDITAHAGVLYIADHVNRIRSIGIQSRNSSTLAGCNPYAYGDSVCYGDVDGVGSSALFSFPSGVAAVERGSGPHNISLYVADTDSNVIRVIVVDGTLPTTTTRTNTAAIVGGVAAAVAAAAAVSYIIYKRKFFFGRRPLPAEAEVQLMSDKPV